MARIESQSIGGYYPTPPELLPLIASHVGVEGATAVVDPCAGEGTALEAFRSIPGKYSSSPARYFACELERTRGKVLLDRAGRTSHWNVLVGDAFNVDFDDRAGLLYLNPPYDLDAQHKRLEQRFLARFEQVLHEDGVLVFVVPGHALAASAELLVSAFRDLQCFRFPGAHYETFKQVVLYARKRATPALIDASELARVLSWAAGPEKLPELTLVSEPSYRVDGFYHGMRWALRETDYRGLVESYTPHAVLTRARSTQASPLAPPSPADLSFRQFPTAVPPKPAHLAAGIASGVFDGVRLAPDDPQAGLPDLLVKGVFSREYVAVEEKKDKHGAITAVVEVQQPQLSVTALDLSTLTYHTLRPTTDRAERFNLTSASTADLLHWYSRDLLRSLLDHCPVQHDPTNPAHTIALHTPARPLYRAQAHATMACVKLLGGPNASKRQRQGKAALLLGEIGVGKSSVALVTAATLGAQKTLVMCPPHLLASWEDQVRAVLPDTKVCVLTNVQDVEDFAALIIPQASEDQPPPPFTRAVAIVSRETAKLSHGYAPVTTGRCPRCHHPVPKEEDLARTRAHCTGTLAPEPKGNAAILVRDLFLASWTVVGPKLTDRNAWFVPRSIRRALDRTVHDSALGTVEYDKIRALFPRLAQAHLNNPELGFASVLVSLLHYCGENVVPFVQWLAQGAATLDVASETWTAYRMMLLRVASLAHEDPTVQAALGALWPYLYPKPSYSYRDPLTLQKWTDHVSALVRGERGSEWSLDWLSLPTGEPGASSLLFDALSSLHKHVTPPTGEPCNEPLYQAIPEPRRVALAHYIAKHHPNLADFLVLDEVHELATEGSAQEVSGHRLAGLGWPTLYLTGSVMNGYAESLFTNFWAISPAFRAEFPRDAKRAFVDRYGYRKRVIQTVDAETKAPLMYGSQSDRVETRVRDAGNAPGVLPLFVLRHLLPVSVTLHKTELALDLPSCTETAVPIVAPAELLDVHNRLKRALFDEIKRTAFTEDSGKLWGAVAELPGHLDRCTQPTGNIEDGAGTYEIRYPDGRLIASAPPVYQTEPTAKEQWILDTVRAELDEGRNVLVLGYHLNVLPRLAALIEERLGEKVAVLHAAKVPTGKRQAWIDKEVIGKRRRVMVANPTTIQTGLNNLVWFATQVWAQNPACNPLTYRQAIGRIDRIGQTKPTRVFFPYYEDTSQAALRDLLSRKVNVSMSTDGIDPESAMNAAGLSQDLTLASLSVGRQLYKLLSEEE